MRDNLKAAITYPCPACGEPIDLSDVRQHEIVECEMCLTEFELTNEDPPELEEVPEDEEDYGE